MSTTTTVTETVPVKATVKPHKDSMKSTWRNNPSVWGPAHRILNLIDLFSRYEDRPIPHHDKTDKVPYLSEFQTNRWILSFAFLTMALHQAYMWVTGQNLGYVGAFVLYSAAYQINAIILVRLLRRLGHLYGFFDGDSHDRDGVPDNNVAKTFISLAATTFFRPLMTVALSYKPDQGPMSFNPLWLVVEIGAYSVILDFYFYWYHRCVHEFDGLWKYHRTHHLTKHPIALLSAFADEEQELFEILGCPLLTFLTMRLFGLPMSFYEWYVYTRTLSSRRRADVSQVGVLRVRHFRRGVRTLGPARVRHAAVVRVPAAHRVRRGARGRGPRPAPPLRVPQVGQLRQADAAVGHHLRHVPAAHRERRGQRRLRDARGAAGAGVAGAAAQDERAGSGAADEKGMRSGGEVWGMEANCDI
ncbi:MAG: sterol desaturase family protein [Terriglobus roseus]|nr:sterol desaturase family protein [Terriglobus roseus]